MAGRPDLIKVAVVKETRDTILGITFRQDVEEDVLLINTITPDSLFAYTRLRPGMELLKINGVSADCLSLKQAMKILRDATDVVTIEAQARGGIIEQDLTRAREEQVETILPVFAEPEHVLFGNETENEPEIIVMQQSNIHAPGNAATFQPVVQAEPYYNSATTTATTTTHNGDDNLPVATAEIMVDSMRGAVFSSIDALPVENYPTTATTNRQSAVITDTRDEENGLVLVTCTKPTADTPTGIGISKMPNGAGAKITSLKTFSIFNGTNLRVGMQILSINGVDCANATPQHCAMLLRNSRGNVTICALCASVSDGGAPTTTRDLPLTTVTINKPHQYSTVGLTIYDKALPNGKKIPVVSKIASNGLFANTSLQPGMRVLSINGISCRGRDDTIAMVRIAQGNVVVMAGPLSMVTATVTKATRDTRVGLNMRRLQGGALVVGTLTSASLFARTDLQEGMRILRINNVTVDGMESAAISALIATAESTVTVLAEEDLTTPTVLASAVTGNPVPVYAADDNASISNRRDKQVAMALLACVIFIGIIVIVVRRVTANKANDEYYNSYGDSSYNNDYCGYKWCTVWKTCYSWDYNSTDDIYYNNSTYYSFAAYPCEETVYEYICGYC